MYTNVLCRNRGRAEESIVEGYLAEECLTFYSLYFVEEIVTKFNHASCNDDDVNIITIGVDGFSVQGRPLGNGDAKLLDDEKLREVYQYVLFNCDSVKPFIE
ncbi:hypothetical protein ACH5RR_013089 [Cinchona calisaya]|uniref:DUF4218 domain-containing protein n=1 Tax=Cinchona calisaya TaxID=153742 RepID=A0ABD3A2P8_9GENT